MNVAILVPFSPDACTTHRLHAWWFVKDGLEERHRDWPIITAASSEPWSKGTALAAARRETNADVLVVHDADVIVSADALWEAVDVIRGGAPWAVPHREVHRLSEAVTWRVLAQQEALDTPRPDAAYDRRPYVGIIGGGITVVRADVWDDCPVDPRFTGWGGEDEAWGWALRCLYGAPWRGSAPLWHLWHPHPAPGARHATTGAGHQLWRAYRHKIRRPDLMRALVEQAR